MNNISQGLLQQNIRLKILAINTFKHPLNVAALPDDYVRKTNIDTVFIDTRINFFAAFLNFFSNDSYNVKRFYSKKFEKIIAETLQKDTYNIVHLESLFVTPYLDVIRNTSGAKIIYRAHNLEFKIWKELASREKKFLKKNYLRFLARRIKNYEINMMNRFDGIAAISGEDIRMFYEAGCTVPVTNIPFGLNTGEYTVSRFPAPVPNLFFLGSMDWLPNIEGMEWFLQNVWQISRSRTPALKLVIAGKSMSRNFNLPNIPGVEISGEVADAKKFMLDNGVMVVPLLSGSGVRVKIIEAMALGKVVIATSVAAKGIPCEHKKNILLADSPEEFAEMIHFVITQNEERSNISENARKFVEENYDNRIIAEKLIFFYNHICADSHFID